MVRSFSWLEYMPVTHGVAGSSPVRTAEILKRKFRDFLFSVASPQPSNIRFCGNRQKSAEQPSKQCDAPPGKSTAYGSRNPDSTDIGEVHNVDSLSANPGRGPGHMDDTDKKEKSPSIRRALFLSCFDEATFTNLT